MIKSSLILTDSQGNKALTLEDTKTFILNDKEIEGSTNSSSQAVLSYEISEGFFVDLVVMILEGEKGKMPKFNYSAYKTDDGRYTVVFVMSNWQQDMGSNNDIIVNRDKFIIVNKPTEDGTGSYKVNYSLQVIYHICNNVNAAKITVNLYSSPYVEEEEIVTEEDVITEEQPTEENNAE